MPGSVYEKLVAVVNTNPNPGLRAYLNIQLTEPFSQLFYAARRLKAARVIVYYRLDENGFTWVATKEGNNTFKFTSLQQLDKLGVQVPGELREELRNSQARREKLEKEGEKINLARANEPRPGPANLKLIKTICQVNGVAFVVGP